ncbi:hypothetical protein CCU68_30210 [Pseudomonas gingeri NCPPB 3146 = LMG 5327]|uniref:Uncharacterized protein n=1 Tax=Pseudomonas gingeri NCPPB 3146 = LMG 5327 TaxID=707248 RepID=A0ABX4XUM5_9PSED|nr:hypothetical protein CCU68_30210 [Pseudomonas gingeri NCPPB 3146 = LMG 5327]
MILGACAGLHKGIKTIARMIKTHAGAFLVSSSLSSHRKVPHVPPPAAPLRLACFRSRGAT